MSRGVRAAGIMLQRCERRSLRGAFLFAWGNIHIHAARLRFPNRSENKTSPQSWRQLSLFDRAGELLLDAISSGGIELC
jgi:hypothetical protein